MAPDYPIFHQRKQPEDDQSEECRSDRVAVPYFERLAELDFHNALVQRCENVLLGFMCRFLASLLRALHAGRADAPREIRRDHMAEAEKYMLEMAAIRAPGESLPRTWQTGEPAREGHGRALTRSSA